MLGLALWLALVAAAGGQELPGPIQPLTVTVDPERVLESRFLGFGVQWEYEFGRPELNLANDVWLAHWPEVLRRLDAMRPALFRVMLMPADYLRLDGGVRQPNGDYAGVEGGVLQPDFDSPAMRGFHRLLDYAQSRGTPVLLGVWHKPTQVASLTDRDWPERLLAPLVRHLRVEHGYDTIRWFNLVNEPSGQRFEYDDWAVAIANLQRAFEQQGLAGQVRTVGSDGPGDWDQWLERAAGEPRVRDALGAYEYHLYAHLNTDKWMGGLLEGRLETEELAAKRRAVSALDPNGAGKPFFMGEAGIDDGMVGDVQPHRYEFQYGVWMADYAIQSMRAGQAGLIAWDLDDAMHTWGRHGSLGLKGWGFWNSLGGDADYPASDFDLRPWFYTWSLLCRCFPAGSQTLAVSPSGDPAVRVAAARLPGNAGLSLALVSEAQTAREVSVRMPGGPGPVTLHEYRYFAAERPVDADGFPTVAATRERVGLAAGLSVSLPASGVVILTTAPPPAAPVRVAPGP